MSTPTTVVINEIRIILDISPPDTVLSVGTPSLPSPRSAGDLLVAVTAAGFVVARPLINNSMGQLLFNSDAVMVTA